MGGIAFGNQYGRAVKTYMRENNPCLLYTSDGYAHLWKERAAYRHTLETTVYLAPGYEGKGIGRELSLIHI